MAVGFSESAGNKKINGKSNLQPTYRINLFPYTNRRFRKTKGHKDDCGLQGILLSIFDAIIERKKSDSRL